MYAGLGMVDKHIMSALPDDKAQSGIIPSELEAHNNEHNCRWLSIKWSIIML